MKTVLRGWTAGAALMMTALAAGCGEAGGADRVTRPEPVASLDGETIFRGIFFGEGPAARALPELWEGRSLASRAPDAAMAARVRQVEAAAVARVRARDPGYFGELEAALRSGDQVRVEAALVRGSDALRAMRAEAQAAEASGEEAIVLYPVLYPYIVVDPYPIFAVVLPFPPVLWLSTPTIEDEAASLARDELVEMLTVRFAEG